MWLSDGCEFEDVPHWYLMYLRSKNHFHNPINEQGFSGIWDTEFLSGIAAINWALLPQNMQSPGGYYSWADVRSYYLKALTLGTKTDRDTNFAQTFRGLGQLMHLVQDMSVPEHTRNDGHYLPFTCYEYWVETSVRNYGVPMPDSNKGHFFTGSISSIKSFMDTDTYTGSNPEVTAYSTIGLSEFSNANFFSDDSIFTGFTYPSVAGATLWTDTTNNRQYLKKTTEGVPIEHLATSSWLYFYRWQKFPQYSEWLPLGLDSKVYSDYAALLLPRAVGYSAGLLNYFFRGKIDMIKESSNSNQYIIKNLSNENMAGTFSLYYDDANDNRYLAASWRNLAINANNQSSPVTFTAPSFPAPKEKGKYVLVFQGTFGNESGAVMGKVVEGLCAGQWVETGACGHRWRDLMGNLCIPYSETIDGKYKYGCISQYGPDCWTEGKCVDGDGNCRTRAWCDENGKTNPPCEDECCICNDYNCSGIMSNVTQSLCYHTP